MFNQERQNEIILLLKNKKRMTTKEVAEYFNVSIDSIRRDFITLENAGKLKRAHGGAIINEPSLVFPPNEEIRFSNFDDEKIKIAKLASSYINENETIFLLGNSIQFAMVEYLPIDIKYTIVTNSLLIANKLKQFENIHVIQVGGVIKPSGNTTDSIAVSFIEHFHFDKCFISCGGIDQNNITTSTPEVALFTKKIIENSNETLLLLHHEKMNRTLFSKVESIENIDTVIIENAYRKEFELIYENKTNILSV